MSLILILQNTKIAKKRKEKSLMKIPIHPSRVPLDHPILGLSPNLGPLISRWEINKFENC
jgi:hypothetical protein